MRARVAAWAGGVDSVNLGSLVDRAAIERAISPARARVGFACGAVRFAMDLAPISPEVETIIVNVQSAAGGRRLVVRHAAEPEEWAPGA